MVVNRQDRSTAVVGGMVIAAVVAFTALFIVATNRSLAQKRAALWIQLPTAEGLRRGDAVQFRGVQVGEVKRLEFSPDGRVLVRTVLTRSVPLTSHAVARLVAVDMFGRQSVVLAAGIGGRPLAAGDTLRGVPPVSLTDRIGSMAERVERVVGDTTVDGLHAMLADAASSLDALQRTLVAAEQTLRAAERVVEDQQRPLGDMIAGTAGLAANLRTLTDTAALAPLRVNAVSTMAHLDRITARLDTASLTMLGALARVEAGEGSLGMLSADPALYQRTVAALDSFERLLTDVRENPKRYINVRVF